MQKPATDPSSQTASFLSTNHAEDSANSPKTECAECVPGVDLQGGDGILGRYTVIEELGRGKMGVVYRCREKVGNVHAAVKILSQEVSHNADEMEGVRKNYQIIHKLRHANIAGVKTLEKDEDGNYYLVMDIADGETLGQWMRTHPDAERKHKLAILRQIADALDYAHSNGIIHRDIKPDNIMVDGVNKVEVIDFGLAATIGPSPDDADCVVTSKDGTPYYKAPEQWLGHSQGRSTDVYSFAVLAYKLLTGKLPFQADDPAKLSQAVLTSPVPTIANVPRHVNAAFAKGLAKSPEDRFASCAEFLDALEGMLKPVSPKSKGRWLVCAAIIVAIIALPTIWFAVHRAKSPAPVSRPVPPPSPASVSKPVPAPSPVPVSRPATAPSPASVSKPVPPPSPARESPKPLPPLPKAGEEGTITLPGNVKIQMVWCPAGEFDMGAVDGEEDEKNVHAVRLSKGFWIGKYEITNAQWESVMSGNAPSESPDGNHPVSDVSWMQCRDFCRKAGHGLRLPTEAEWEYACHAKSMGASLEQLADMAWCQDNSQGHAHPVGMMVPNQWGICDMHGNVGEWCHDWYGAYGTEDVADPTGPDRGEGHVVRGGSWRDVPRFCRSESRSSLREDDKDKTVGFRVVSSSLPLE